MKIETKHTPGPWELELEQCDGEDGPNGGESGHLYVNCDSGTVASVGPCGLVKDDEDRANARLIAAAPELLEACQQALTHIAVDETTHGRNFAAGNVLRAAIAKATGEVK